MPTTIININLLLEACEYTDTSISAEQKEYGNPESEMTCCSQ